MPVVTKTTNGFGMPVIQTRSPSLCLNPILGRIWSSVKLFACNPYSWGNKPLIHCDLHYKYTITCNHVDEDCCLLTGEKVFAFLFMFASVKFQHLVLHSNKVKLWVGLGSGRGLKIN